MRAELSPTGLNAINYKRAEREYIRNQMEREPYDPKSAFYTNLEKRDLGFKDRLESYLQHQGHEDESDFRRKLEDLLMNYDMRLNM